MPEIIDVPDEPQAQVIPQKDLLQRQQQITDDAVIEHPEPRRSAWMNSMKDQLDVVEKELIKPSQQAKDASQAPKQEEPLKQEAKVEQKAEPDAKAEGVVDDGKTFTSAKAADWKKLKEAITTEKNKAIEYEKKLQAKEKEFAEAQAKFALADRTPEWTKQIDEIKAERDKLANQIQTTDLERYEPFAKQYADRFNKAAAQAKDAVGEANAERIEQLMQLKPSKWRKERLNEIRQDLTGVDQGQLDIAISDFDRARAEKESALADSKTNYQRAMDLESERRNREQVMAEARVKDSISRVLTKAREFEAFRTLETDPEHNASVRENEAMVERFFSGKLETEQAAILPILAGQCKYLMTKVLPSMNKEIAELKAALEAQKGATPAPKGGQQAKSNGSERKTFAQQVLEQMGNQ